MKPDEVEIDSEDEIYLSTRQACKLWGVTSQSLGNWTGEGFPKTKRGKFPLFACHEWVRKFKTGDSEASLAEERRRKTAAEAKLKELELLVKEGKLISKEEVLAEFTERIVQVKTGLLSLARLIAPMIVGKDIREIIQIVNKSVLELLDRFSRKGGILK